MTTNKLDIDFDDDLWSLIFEPRIKPAYLAKLKKIEKERTIRIGTLNDFKKMFKAVRGLVK